MIIIIPKDSSSTFVNEINEFARCKDVLAEFYYDDMLTRGIFTWLQYRAFNGLTEEFINEYFAARFPHLTIIHTKKEEEDNFFAYEEKITVNAGDCSSSYTVEELVWREKVIEVVKQFDFAMPFTLELNGKDSGMPRYMPTVMLTP